MSKKLSDIRVEIDSIDNQIHDLLMRRAAIVSSVAAAKKKEGLQIVHPAREAKMIRRLFARHDGNFPRSVIINIWREMVGVSYYLQTTLSVIVASDGDEAGSYWDMARNYFGSAIAMSKVGGAKQAVAGVENDEASFAVVKWPELSEEAPWWGYLFNKQGESKMSIICALPYAKQSSKDKALIISKVDFVPSDDDMSFIGLEFGANVSRDFIFESAKKAGFEVVNLYSSSDNKLLEVEGFVDSEGAAISSLKENLGSECSYCSVIGGYPVLADISE